LLCDYRCTDDLGSHLDETVLAKLPDNYQSILKQSITSEEDDMGTRSSLSCFHSYSFFLVFKHYLYLLCMNGCADPVLFTLQSHVVSQLHIGP
jgi:hypothetical protein